MTKLATCMTRVSAATAAFLASAALLAAPAAHAAWEPTKPVEFVVPAGTGGGADQMARLIQGIVVKHNLMKQPLVVVNKSGGASSLALHLHRPPLRSLESLSSLIRAQDKP